VTYGLPSIDTRIPPDVLRSTRADSEEHETQRGRKVVTMIDWDSENWGGTVHLAANGSWVRDKQRPDSDGQD
jgi:hypothetical protein